MNILREVAPIKTIEILKGINKKNQERLRNDLNGYAKQKVINKWQTNKIQIENFYSASHREIDR